jgi:hypothetical protein
MLALAPSLGCATPNPECLCANPNFGYGIRDCADAACGGDTEASSSVVAYVIQYCAGTLLQSPILMFGCYSPSMIYNAAGKS